MSHTLTFRVRYQETDQMGIVHHGNYVTWMEMGRVEYLRDLSVPYTEVEAQGVWLVVSGIGLTYRQPAKFDDVLRLHSRLTVLRSRMARFEYRLERASDGALLAEGFSEHIATDPSRRPVRIPNGLFQLLSGVLESSPST